MTPRAKRVILQAINEARDLGHIYVGTEHLLIALLHEGGGAAGVLDCFSITLEQVRNETIKILSQNAIPRAHNNLGNAYAKQGNLDEAVEEYKKALVVNPNYAQAHKNLGIVFDKQGNLDEAVVEYNKALTVNTNYAEAHKNLGIIYGSKGSWVMR